MATEQGNDDWPAEHPALWVEKLPDANGQPHVAMLRHPERPYTGTVREAALESGLRQVANGYLAQAGGRAGIPDWALAALRDDDLPGFGWLALSWGVPGLEPGQRDPRRSFMVARFLEDRTRDRTAVLLGGLRRADGKSQGGEVGLRVVMHLSEPEDGAARVRVTGMTLTRLPAVPPAPPAIESAAPAPAQVPEPGLEVQSIRPIEPHEPPSQRPPSKDAAPKDPSRPSLVPLSARLGQLLSLSGVKLSGVAPAGPPEAPVLRLFGAGRQPSGREHLREPGRIFSFVVEIPTAGDRVRLLSRVERLADAAPQRVFLRDAASMARLAQQPPVRPTGLQTRLDTYRIPTDRVPVLVPLSNSFAEVKCPQVGQVNADPQQVATLRDDGMPLRSDNLAGAHAWLRALELQDRLERYGLRPEVYFRHARLPLVLRHRAALNGDGEAVNARVRPSDAGPGVDEPMLGPGGEDPRPQVEVHFGAASLTHRSMQPNDAGVPRAQPMGLAADARWAWHEFGHVLNFASFGELEFRFAHSAGDAMAAIVADPRSRLARRPQDGERFQTFPWVQTRRRHDRGAFIGWCWCGRRNAVRTLSAIDAVRTTRLGYFEEQLLSSSLFRLYRCIGGDTFERKYRRRLGASDYAVYLIMRAISLLGAESVVPARTVDQFVSALMDADEGTGLWTVQANWPNPALPQRTVTRIGGCLRKVIRWAFEQQGLYATDDARAVAEGVGRPPAVDLFIPDRRPAGDGGYEPVSLHWSPDPAAPTPWQAGDGSIDVDGAGRVVVQLRNRGSEPARNVTVAVWAAAVPAPGTAPAWSPLAQGTAPDVAPGDDEQYVSAPLGAARPAGRVMLWALAGCDADRPTAPADRPGDRLLGQADPALLADLVANDNNQGLRVIDL